MDLLKKEKQKCVLEVIGHWGEWAGRHLLHYLCSDQMIHIIFNCISIFHAISNHAS